MVKIPHCHGWLRCVPLDKGQKHNQRLHLCLVRVAKDSHHSKAPLVYPIGDEDHHWDDLHAHHSLAGAGGEVDSDLTPHLWGDQPGEEPLQNHTELEGT